jgi:integrase/recombinase XerD
VASGLAADVEDFLTSLTSERGLATNTVSAYERDLRQYLEYLDGIEQPTAGDVSGFVASLRAARLAPRTVARKTAAVRMFHRFLVTEGVTGRDPTVLVESARLPSSLPKALPYQTIERLLVAPPPDTPLGRRDRALLEFLYGTAARVSEVVALDLSGIDLETGTAILTGKGSKQRLVPLGSYAIQAIGDYLPDRLAMQRGQQDALFLNARGRRLTRQGVWEIVRKAAQAAGVPRGEVSPHVFRHSAATHMVEGGADLRTVQQLLGHATITTTQVYTRVSPQHLLEVYAMSHPRSN